MNTNTNTMMPLTVLRVGESADRIAWSSAWTRDCTCSLRPKVDGRRWPCGKGPCLTGPSRLLDVALLSRIGGRQ